MRVSGAATLLTAACLCAGAAFAGDTESRSEPEIPNWADTVYLQGGIAGHWSDSEDYDGTPLLGGIEISRQDRHRFGIALFNNSYNQFSQYY